MPNYQPTSKNQIGHRVHQTGINGLYYLDHDISIDNRGYFTELAIIDDLEKVLGVSFPIRQLNLAHSQNYVIRGFHAEGWSKLITLVRGTAFSALLDIRPESPQFGQTETFLLGDQPDALSGSLFIPMGVANSVCVVNGPVDYLYCVDRLYRDRDKPGDMAISLFDPDVPVKWPIPREKMILSDRDLKSQTLRQRFPQKFT